MKTEEKVKKRGSRSISIVTVALWLVLIVIMTVITINFTGFRESNALEETDDIVRVKIKLEDPSNNSQLKEEYKNLNIEAYRSITPEKKDLVAKFEYKEIDADGNYVYETNKTALADNLFNLSATSYYITIGKVSLNGYNLDVTENGTVLTEEYEYFAKYLKSAEVAEYTLVSTYNVASTVKIRVIPQRIEDAALISKLYDEMEFTVTFNETGGRYDNFHTWVNLNDEEDGVKICKVENLKPNTSISFLSGASHVNIEGYNVLTEYVVDGTSTITTFLSDITTPEAGKELVIDVNIHFLTDESRSTKSVKWIDENTGKATITLGYKSTGGESIPLELVYNTEDIIYADVLSDDFDLSNEYEASADWTFLDKASDKNNLTLGIPENVMNAFYTEEGIYTGKKFVYIKDSKTIYWLEKEGEIAGNSIDVNVVYNKYNDIIENAILNSNKNANLVAVTEYGIIEKYNILSPKLKFSHLENAVIKVNKFVDGQTGNKTYYVGIFEDETSAKTDKVYSIDCVDGNGSTTIELTENVRNKNYYIYEVDELGNKIIDENIKYTRNNIQIQENQYIRDAKITTDKSIVSSLMSENFNYDKIEEDENGNYIFNSEENLSSGTGEDDYIDNVLSVNDIYQDSIAITSKEIILNVKYEAEEGGKIVVTPEEKVKVGEYPQNVPQPTPDDGYKFVRWEVEKDGVRMEVIPNEYQINEDTIFYAIFEKIPAKVIIKYVDEEGNELLPKDEINGYINDEYKTSKKPVDGYEASGKDPENAKGKMLEEVTEVIYVYRKTSVDTGDINVGMYIVVSFVAIVGIASVLYFSLKKKRD